MVFSWHIHVHSKKKLAFASIFPVTTDRPAVHLALNCFFLQDIHMVIVIMMESLSEARVFVNIHASISFKNSLSGYNLARGNP